MSVDVREHMLHIMQEWGHDVLLQRRLPLQPGDLYYETGKFSDTLERHTVRNSLRANLGRAVEEQLEGLVTNVDTTFYFLWDANPGAGDRIYEPDPRSANGQIVWTIDYAHPMRGRGGRVEFWVCGVTQE